MQVGERDVAYRLLGTEPLLARVYTPEGPEAQGPFPLLLDVHGGAWSAGERTSNAGLDRMLAALGLVVVAIDFRLAPQHPYPAMMEDLDYAVRWARVHAVELSARPGQMGAIGTSSGGHMALLAAVRPFPLEPPGRPREEGGAAGASAPAGGAARTVTPVASGARVPACGAGAPEGDATLAFVVACWPPVDPYERYVFSRETGRADLVRHTEGCFRSVDAMHDASPLRIVERGEAQALPPVLIVQGTADANIPLPMIERFAAAYRAAGGELQLALFEGQPHGFMVRPSPGEGGAAERALALVRDFIARHAGV